MEKFLNHYLYWFDYLAGYMMTNPRNLPFYHRYMYEKYGTRYCSQEQFDQYWNDAGYSEQ
jgi:hypothetical protein